MFKDTRISAASKKRELSIFLVCFALAFFLNVFAIIKHGSPVRELFTQLHVVGLMSLFFYFLIVVLRILYHLLSRLRLRK